MNEMNVMLKWGSIDQLPHVVNTLRHLNANHGTPLPRVTYRGKVKLHGTNAGVRRTDDGVRAQSRSQEITDGHMGFATWLDDNTAVFNDVDVGTTVYGEWCGPGVQRGVAVTQIDRKVFAVFAARRGDVIVTCPQALRDMLRPHPDVFVLDWHTESFVLDFANVDDDTVQHLNTQVADIEAEDPFVKAQFGISGVGEGLVLYPLAVEGTGSHDVDLDVGVRHVEQWHLLAFKAKGDKHRTVKSKKAVQVDPEVAASVERFVDLVVTEARLAQAAEETDALVDGIANPKRMGAFLKWLADDVHKETQAELQASGLTSKQVNKALSQRARTWLLGRR